MIVAVLLAKKFKSFKEIVSDISCASASVAVSVACRLASSAAISDDGSCFVVSSSCVSFVRPASELDEAVFSSFSFASGVVFFSSALFSASVFSDELTLSASA